MSNADVVLFGLIAISTFIGMFRGFFHEAFSLLVWSVSLFVAYTFAGMVAPMIGRAIGNETMAFPLAMVVLFVGCLVVGFLGRGLGKSWLAGAGLGGLDRILGMAFGAARGGIVAVVLLIALRPFFADSPWWHESIAVRWLMGFEEEVLSGLRTLGAARERAFSS